ncbi:hypothetical protein B0I35DRAFT_485568 [Stachybotrys elegans]|uniref:Uncharacterized protein n=1 Tax=Stachybotrys elegans TaxID=80388 RepID=A0A8K0SFK7_9HYPO|nr:hypothetical protein B0I35DRAFT_485568 [Stachybotrys elegans]
MENMKSALQRVEMAKGAGSVYMSTDMPVLQDLKIRTILLHRALVNTLRANGDEDGESETAKESAKAPIYRILPLSRTCGAQGLTLDGSEIPRLMCQDNISALVAYYSDGDIVAKPPNEDLTGDDANFLQIARLLVQSRTRAARQLACYRHASMSLHREAVALTQAQEHSSAIGTMLEARATSLGLGFEFLKRALQDGALLNTVCQGHAGLVLLLPDHDGLYPGATSPQPSKNVLPEVQDTVHVREQDSWTRAMCTLGAEAMHRTLGIQREPSIAWLGIRRRLGPGTKRPVDIEKLRLLDGVPGCQCTALESE